MNVGGHIAVARLLTSDTVVWLGSALPDVGAMGHFNLLGEKPTGSLAEGIALHHATDDTFHSHPWFRSRQDDLYKILTDAGIKRGPARAVAHVGPELLLDGEYLKDRGVLDDIEAGMGELANHLDEIEVLVPDEKRDAWRAHLERVSVRDTPFEFGDPIAVAQILRRILSKRPRLALAEDQVDVVGAILTDAQPSIIETAHDLAKDLAQRLSA